MNYISKNIADKHFSNLLAIHKMENSFADKVTFILNDLVAMLSLPELAGVSNEKSGQIRWLTNNKIKRVYGQIKSGEIPEDLVQRLISIFPSRNKAQHQKVTTYGAYLGIFDCMSQAISFFSNNTPLPKEIQAICDGKDFEKKTKNNDIQVNKTNDINSNKSESNTNNKTKTTHKSGNGNFNTNGNFKVGDNGPAGGIIFYDKGYFSDGWRYLEMAPLTIKITAQWGMKETIIPDISTAVGSGRKNTQNILTELKKSGKKMKGNAAHLCTRLKIRLYTYYGGKCRCLCFIFHQNYYYFLLIHLPLIFLSLFQVLQISDYGQNYKMYKTLSKDFPINDNILSLMNNLRYSHIFHEKNISAHQLMLFHLIKLFGKKNPINLSYYYKLTLLSRYLFSHKTYMHYFSLPEKIFL